VQDVTFHQCVNLGRFNTEKVVSFVPPDGEFELMKYRCQESIALPFKVLPIINEVGTPLGLPLDASVVKGAQVMNAPLHACALMGEYGVTVWFCQRASLLDPEVASGWCFWGPGIIWVLVGEGRVMRAQYYTCGPPCW
jgi:hypothetical protein